MTRQTTISPLFPYTTLFRSYGYSPLSLKTNENLSSVSRPPELNFCGVSVLVAVCGASSLLIQVTFVPGEIVIRSEEHTSELQSHVNLVCRLLLEKKNVSCKN